MLSERLKQVITLLTSLPPMGERGDAVVLSAIEQLRAIAKDAHGTELAAEPYEITPEVIRMAIGLSKNKVQLASKLAHKIKEAAR